MELSKAGKVQAIIDMLKENVLSESDLLEILEMRPKTEKWYRHEYWQNHAHDHNWEHKKVMSEDVWTDYTETIIGKQIAIKTNQPCEKPEGVITDKLKPCRFVGAKTS